MSDNSVIEITREFTYGSQKQNFGFILDKHDKLYVNFPATAGYKIPSNVQIIEFITKMKQKPSDEYEIALRLVGGTLSVSVIHDYSYSVITQFMKQLNVWIDELIIKGVWQLIQDIHNPESADKLRKLYTK